MINNNQFLEDFKKYKKLKMSGAKASFSLLKICLIFIIPLSLALAIFFKTPQFLLITPAAIIFVLVKMVLELIPGNPIFLLPNNDKLRTLFLKINNSKYNGLLYDLFDKDCLYTQSIMKKHKDEIAKSILEDKGISGSLATWLLDEVIKLENETQKIDKLEEEKSVIIKNNTISSLTLKQ